MKHLGDIQKIDWAAVEPVDCVTGGSPCQDLSIAGKRAGLAGERSGLFMEQIKCIKELREADEQRGRTGHLVRPRFMVWENVPGAFSSNKGEDFKAVLEETIRIVEPEAPDLSVPDKGWPYSGCIYDDMGKWSVAWRLHDAQFWGVPQRRKRIALVADFGGLYAPEVLFERKGLSGDFEPSGETREETPGRPGSCAEGTEPTPINTMIATRDKALGRGTGMGVGEPGDASYTILAAHEHAIYDARSFTLKIRGGADTYRKPDGSIGTAGKGPLVQKELSGTIGVTQDQTLFVLQSDGTTSRNSNGCGYQKDIGYTLNQVDRQSVAYGTGGNNTPLVTDAKTICLNDQGGSAMNVSEDVTGALRAQEHGHQPLVFDARGNGDGEIVPTMTGDHQNRVTDYTAVILPKEQTYQKVTGTLSPGGHPGSYNGQDAYNDMLVGHKGMSVRRLTPLECERLQGFPDGWTDIGEWVDSKGKKHKDADSPRYKALGNSIALPFWFWLLRRISAQYERPATLGSLFDGIGGFPCCWEKCNGEGTARWASEIEEFPIAVTKIHFPEVDI